MNYSCNVFLSVLFVCALRLIHLWHDPFTQLTWPLSYVWPQIYVYIYVNIVYICVYLYIHISTIDIEICMNALSFAYINLYISVYIYKGVLRLVTLVYCFIDGHWFAHTNTHTNTHTPNFSLCALILLSMSIVRFFSLFLLRRAVCRLISEWSRKSFREFVIWNVVVILKTKFPEGFSGPLWNESMTTTFHITAPIA